MKKLILAAALFVATVAEGYAQKGTWEINGSLSFNTGKIETDVARSETSTKLSGTYFSVSPTVFYNVSDKWAVGLGVGFQSGSIDMSDGLVNALFQMSGQSVNYQSMDDISFTGFYVTPQVRFRQHIAHGFSWAPLGYVKILSGKGNLEYTLTSNVSAKSKPSISGFTVGIEFARFEYAITKHWDLTLSLGNVEYRDYKFNGDDSGINFDLDGNSFTFNLFTKSTIGLSYRF